ncbi:thymidine phosphorylase [Horticoccus sp. 23ND18S-11]|uniref:thymidine phosphorylase n=1 Tax=Horticoccus sp. 23ND18S-11 TaxID=3391832 RepID=UPI0039C959A3
MFPQHIIARKRDGHVLSREEIAAFVRGATDGSWADYQLTALLMAIFLRGMTPEETADYTDAMMRSGVVADLSNVPGIKVDKHSTGGVGDKISIPLAPMVVACGVPVPMISGRGLGHSGGTLDKLESIPGFRTDLSLDVYRAQVARIGCALIGQTKDLAPSDKKLYALRDVTATVECIPLICGSILSKKLAEGIDALVLDVKVGRGAFMKTKEEARRLAEALVRVGQAGGKKVRALLTAMDQPLGRTVGNALEVAESIDCLRGHGPADTMEVTYALGAHMLVLAGVSKDEASARAQLERVVSNGAALTKFREIVAAQGGDVRSIDDPTRLPQATLQRPLPAPRGGVVVDVDAMGVALAALRLGAGRAKADDTIDPGVGVSALKKIGEKVTSGEPLCVIHASNEPALAEARAMLEKAIRVGDTAPAATPLIHEVLV